MKNTLKLLLAVLLIACISTNSLAANVYKKDKNGVYQLQEKKGKKKKTPKIEKIRTETKGDVTLIRRQGANKNPKSAINGYRNGAACEIAYTKGNTLYVNVSSEESEANEPVDYSKLIKYNIKTTKPKDYMNLSKDTVMKVMYNDNDTMLLLSNGGVIKKLKLKKGKVYKKTLINGKRLEYSGGSINGTHYYETEESIIFNNQFYVVIRNNQTEKEKLVKFNKNGKKVWETKYFAANGAVIVVKDTVYLVMHKYGVEDEVYEVGKGGKLTKTKYKDYDEFYANEIDKPVTEEDEYRLLKIIGDTKIYMAYRENGIEFKYGDTVKWLEFKNSKREDDHIIYINDCALVKGKLVVVGSVCRECFGEGSFRDFKEERWFEGFIATL